MPWLSDKIGRRYTDMLLLAALCGFSVWFIYAGSWWVILVYSLLTFCYSGEAAVIPAAGTDLFGQKNAGINYGFLALGMSVGSVASRCWPAALKARPCGISLPLRPRRRALCACGF